MSSMDRNHKSDEAFGPSHSSSSRRVMWKLSDEEEIYESVVNYRRLAQRSNTQQVQQQPRQALQEQKLDNSEKPNTSKNATFAVEAWHQIFKLIRTNKLVEELGATQTLALRYKPSRESLKYRRSKDLSVETSDSPHRFIITDIKVESCCLPPQQMAVVREVAPTFAQRIPNDTDSCCSGELVIQKNSPVNMSNASSIAFNVHRIIHCPKPEGISVNLTKQSSSQLGPAESPSFFSQQHVSGADVKSSSSAASSKRRCAQGCGKSANVAKTNGKAANKPNVSSNSFPTFRQRQLELHRYRVQVEQRRLDLLELKIAREREEAVHNEILFHKDLQIRENRIKSLDDSSISN